MSGKVMGNTFNNGFPGHYAETPDMIIKTFANVGDAECDFGLPVFGLTVDSILGVGVAGSTTLTPTAAIFKGVACASIKSALSYPDQSVGAYTINQQLPVIERGAVSVQCNGAATNAPVVDGAVYVRIATASTGYPIGGFEAAASGVGGADTIAIPNATWGSTADANGVAELILKTRVNS